MTLDEAIKHCEEVAEENQAVVDSCDYYGENMAKCEECAKEHRQLATWLRELKAYREASQSKERTEERTEMHECDCISRKDIGLTNLEILMCNGDYKEALKMLLDKIEKAPSVTPQQKTGHWIEHKHGGIEHIECSKCGVWFLKNNLIRKSYCPNCGSCNGDMIKNILKDIAKKQ